MKVLQDYIATICTVLNEKKNDIVCKIVICRDSQRNSPCSAIAELRFDSLVLFPMKDHVVFRSIDGDKTFILEYDYICDVSHNSDESIAFNKDALVLRLKTGQSYIISTYYWK